MENRTEANPRGSRVRSHRRQDSICPRANRVILQNPLAMGEGAVKRGSNKNEKLEENFVVPLPRASGVHHPARPCHTGWPAPLEARPIGCGMMAHMPGADWQQR